ncbi:MAG: hypothetical protein Q8N35_18085 [Methylococcaceae bacterium]|nr:hypothetical protein [Methylococcaceae bacterium]MDZ4155104.1 hypothetical protein [Methylococcales bacterium]MDP2394451.1 hypothetical protein [Methylococcaceae bacterium]MDP3021494.1 hypothetical protein [Methylococcaceae bacterium]MDP3390387.1 hypothetical protein [Methylococcaceae bacterium]
MSFTKTKLAKAVAIAMAGSALSVAAISDASAATTTMYNLSTANGDDNSTNTTDPTTGGVWALHGGGTDGWTNAAIAPSVGNGTGASKWAGTSGANNVAFGYTGAHLNWGLNITGGNGGTAEISTFDSFNRYGVYADIDVAKGAWSDAALNGASGWRHDLDLGLFKSDSTGLVNLNAQGILQSGTNFGFTIFKGASPTTNYNHHGAWNSNNNASGLTSASLPGGGTNFDPDGAGPLTAIGQIVAYSIGGANPSNLNTISFNAEAGQIYSIFIGGYRNGDWIDTTDGYKLTISQEVSQVPVPGAVWLFGSAMAGLVGFGRRKSKIAA